MAEQALYQGTGKRKTSVARAILRPGDGGWWINGRTLEDYFPRLVHRVQVTSPLKVAGAEGIGAEDMTETSLAMSFSGRAGSARAAVCNDRSTRCGWGVFA